METESGTNQACDTPGESRLYGNIVLGKGVLDTQGRTVILNQSTAPAEEAMYVDGSKLPTKRTNAHCRPDSLVPSVLALLAPDSTALELYLQEQQRPRFALNIGDQIQFASNGEQQACSSSDNDESCSLNDKRKGASKNGKRATSRKSKNSSTGTHPAAKRGRKAKKKDEESDDTITLFSVASLRDFSQQTQQKQKEEKTRNIRTSMNSLQRLSEQQQLEMAMKLSMSQEVKS